MKILFFIKMKNGPEFQVHIFLLGFFLFALASLICKTYNMRGFKTLVMVKCSVKLVNMMNVFLDALASLAFKLSLSK